jgi:sorting nexin-29
MRQFQIPKKLISLVQMTLTDMIGKVEVQSNLTEEFVINRGLRQGDALSTQLFNLILENAIRNNEINQGGSINNTTLQYLAYADDVNLVS